MKKYYFLIFLCLVCFFSATAFLRFAYQARKPAYDFDYEWVQHKYIAHALGGIDGYSYTNSPEAFLANYAKGYRLFEVDLIYTSDGTLVGLHSWKNSNVEKVLGVKRDDSMDEAGMTLKEFKSCKVYERYSCLDIRDLARLLKDRDIYLIIDGKYEEESEVRQEYGDILSAFSEIAPESLDRIIPQIYSEEMLSWVMDIYPWKSMIYTWYKLDKKTYSPLKEIAFAKSAGIRAVTMDQERENDLIDRELIKNGIYPLVHTVNDEAAAREMEEDGAAGFYTEELLGFR